MIAVRFASPVDFCRPNGSAHNSIRKTRPARPGGALTDVMKTSLSLCTDTSSSFAAFAYVSIGLHGSRRAGSNNEQTTMRTTRRLFFGGIISLPAGQKSRRRTDGRDSFDRRNLLDIARPELESQRWYGLFQFPIKICLAPSTVFLAINLILQECIHHTNSNS